MPVWQRTDHHQAPPFDLDAVGDRACPALVTGVYPVARDPLNNPLPALVVIDPGRLRVLTPSCEQHLYMPTAPRVVDAQWFHGSESNRTHVRLTTRAAGHTQGT
jgi:hypothetical protein